MTDAILELSGVNKRREGFALRDVSFTLPRGTIMGFVGPNGAGKTTTLKIVLDLVRKDGGSVRLFGQDHRQDPRRTKQRLGFVCDENVFYDDMSPREIGWLLARFYRGWDGALYRSHLDAFGLPSARKVKELSRGMKAKLALAAALSHGAELIIMDEPTSGLDPIFRAEMLEILSHVIEDANRSVVFSTHITSDLEKIADYVTFIRDGAIVFSREKDDLLAAHAVVKGSRKALDAARGLLIGVREHDHGFEGLTAERERLRPLLGPELVSERASIDDILLFSTKYVLNH